MSTLNEMTQDRNYVSAPIYFPSMEAGVLDAKHRNKTTIEEGGGQARTQPHRKKEEFEKKRHSCVPLPI